MISPRGRAGSRKSRTITFGPTQFLSPRSIRPRRDWFSLAMHFPPDNDDALLRPKEAAELAGVITHTLANWTRAGKLACVRTPNGHRRYRWGDLRVLIKSPGTPTDDELKEIENDVVGLYLQGWSISKVAEKFERNYGDIRRLLVRNHIALRHGPSVLWRRTWGEVAEQIIDSILDGTYKPGHRIPSQNMLALKFTVSRATISHAIRYLGDRGWVLVRPHHGTFVRPRSAWPNARRTVESRL